MRNFVTGKEGSLSTSMVFSGNVRVPAAIKPGFRPRSGIDGRVLDQKPADSYDRPAIGRVEQRLDLLAFTCKKK